VRGPEDTLEKGLGRGLALAAGGANAAGALLTYLYLSFLAPGALQRHASDTDLVVTAVAVPLYVAMVSWLINQRIRDGLHECAACLAQGRPLSEEHREQALRLPRLLTGLDAAAWVGAAVLFGAINASFGNPALSQLRLVVGVLFAGAVTSAITYLVGERRYRPVLVVALGGEPRGSRGLGVEGRMLVVWLIGSALPLAAVVLVPLARTPGGLVSLPVSIASLAGIGLMAGFLLTRGAARSVSEPLSSVRHALEAVRQGDLSVGVPVDDAGEIGGLEAGVNRMVRGLRERRRLVELFGRHVGQEVARRALSEDVVLGGHQLDASVLFVDLVGSTALAATLPPDELVAWLNRFFGLVVEAVTAEGGWVNKFEGDGALCVFGAPVPRPDHAAAALRAARRLGQALAGAGGSDRAFDAGIGVAGGTVVAGNVGAMDRYEYTVIGDPVNEAARLSELAKAAGPVLASGDLLAEAGEEAARWRRRGEQVLRGRRRPTTIMEPLTEPAIRPAPPSLLQPPATAGTIESV